MLVVNKPAGWNTHSPNPYSGEGIYEWLKHRETRWSSLAILHRLDKETSGVLVFGKSAAANRSLTAQFTEHSIRKTYQLLTDRPVKDGPLRLVSTLVRAGEKYLNRPLHAGGNEAETHFSPLEHQVGRCLIEARPVTGRTHQIRVHAAALGFPILGDSLYGGTQNPRLCLHAAEIRFQHPVSGAALQFKVPADFSANARLELRGALGESCEPSGSALSATDPELAQTNSWRLIHGAADGWPGWYVERLGDYLLSQSERVLDVTQQSELTRLMEHFSSRGAYHKTLNRQVGRTNTPQASPQLVMGQPAPDQFLIQENGVNYELSFHEGYSVGLFLDQRDNRRRFLTNHVAAEFPALFAASTGAEVLNTFAYTCGFSVCAAKAGAKTVSLDLSKKYLEWGRRNFAHNGLDAAAHDFIFGDTFDWLRRLAKKGRRFDLIILDPPTFSHSRENGTFSAEKDYGELVRSALPVLNSGGTLLASTNAARVEPETFLETLRTALQSCGRKLLRQHYAPQPPDFPVIREEPAYLKTVWLKIQ